MSKNHKHNSKSNPKNNPAKKEARKEVRKTVPHTEGIKVDFLAKANIFTGLSILLVLVSLVLIFAKGFNYGIDFSGGTEVQVLFNKAVTTDKVRDFTKELGYKSASVQSLGEENSEYLIRMESIEAATDKETNNLINALIDKVTSGLKATFSDSNPEIRRVDSVGPQVGNELKKNGLLAIFYSLLMVLIYIGLRFDYKFAPAAVFCLFHDTIITLGVYALLQKEVNVQTLAAILTIIGYSLNDTIITFDRIRENTGNILFRDWNFHDLVNRSLNDVLSRSLLTSFTTLIAVLAMYFIAGGVIRDFAFTLGIGIVVGTYSSIYIASPLVILIDHWETAKAKAS